MKIKTMDTEVAVIGSGAAGMMAAMEAAERGAKVLLVTKGAVGRGTCSSMAGGFLGASSADRSAASHCYDTLEAGRGLNSLPAVEAVLRSAREDVGRLQEMGVPLLNLPDGYLVDNRGNAREVPGVRLTESMARLVAERGAASLEHFHCLDLLVADGRVQGLWGLDATGEPTLVSAPSVVLATGGAAALYPRHNAGGIMGEGYAMALRAGCELQDMEFVQFYPLGLAEPGLPAAMVYPPYPEGGRLVDGQGKDLLAELPGCRDLADAIVRFRDSASLLLFRKHLDGGAFLDLTQIEPKSWDRLSSLRLLARNSFDFRNRRVRVAPLAHFSIGGVVVDARRETSVQGLFAAGEVVGGFHGANRLGGNALTECIVCGRQAGANAAAHAGRAGNRGASAAGIEALLPGWTGRDGGSGGPAFRGLLKRLQACAWEHAGVIRSREGMRAGLDAVAGIERELAALEPSGNSDGLLQSRLRAAAIALRCTLEAGLRREESRGAFCRSDFPQGDDLRWRCNIRISLNQLGELALRETPL